jgi:tetratricopeptide (TPR) repeat protein
MSMMDFNNAPDMPFDLERLLPEAVAQALSDENPETLLSWLRHKLPQFSNSTFLQEMPQKMFDALTAQLQHVIWNALPLPGNGFSPRPIPLPGRNDPCLCGSGHKYKRCCASAPKFPPLDPLVFWPMVLQQLPKKKLKQALAQGQIPMEGAIAGAINMFDHKHYAKAPELLEPLFTGTLKKPRPEMDLALQTLCDCYDQLGQEREKMALLERITSEAPASPLRAGAWQRLTTMHLDQNDSAAARQAFERAMHDDPDDPSLAFLEMHLLGMEEKWCLAKERARFWLKRLQRPIYDQDALKTLISFLEDAVDDPEEALESLTEFPEDLDPESERLLDWIQEIIGRPLPPYRLVEEPEFDVKDEKEELVEHLQTMGLPEKEIPRALDMLEEQKADVAEEEEADDEKNDVFEEDASLILETPKTLRSLEQRWKGVAGLEKPFGTSDVPMSDWNGWDPELAERWCTFLEQNPKAGDSLEILDDLATALLLHPDESSADLFFDGSLPLLQRAGAIVEKAVAGVESPVLRWNRVTNRAGLRSLVRLHQILHFEEGHEKESSRLLETLLTLNPADNHGLRTEAINDHLRHGRHEAAVELAEKYPDDIFAETRYGLVLALYRLKHAKDAQDAAEKAIAELPLVAQHLVRSRVNRPEISPHGITLGGKDQAWLYREEMREEWKKTHGALAWLAKIMKLKGVSR